MTRLCFGWGSRFE